MAGRQSTGKLQVFKIVYWTEYSGFKNTGVIKAVPIYCSNF